MGDGKAPKKKRKRDAPASWAAHIAYVGVAPVLVSWGAILLVQKLGTTTGIWIAAGIMTLGLLALPRNLILFRMAWVGLGVLAVGGVAALARGFWTESLGSMWLCFGAPCVVILLVEFLQRKGGFHNRGAQ